MSVSGPLGATSPGGVFELKSSFLDARRPLRSVRAGQLGLLLLLAGGVLIALSAAHTEPLLPESARPIPNALAGPFGGAGLNIGYGGTIVVLTLMFAAYVVAVRGAENLSPRLVLGTIAALNALVLLAPPLLSTDIFSYQFYGRIGAVYGGNPYLAGPHGFALDPLYPYIGAKWAYTPSAYGPLFTALSYPLAALGIAASDMAYKAIAAAASLVLVGAVWNAARLRGLNPIKAAVLVGLNPLLLVYGVGGGHNDLLMLAVMMVGVCALLQRRERSGGGLLVAATGIKLTAGVLLPFAVIGDAANRASSATRRRKVLLGAGVAAAVVAALGFAMFGTGPLHLPATLQKTQSAGDWYSVPGFISGQLGLGLVGRAAGVGLTCVLAVIVVWLLRRVWRGQLDWITGAAWATLAVLVTASSLLPWYIAWLLPLAALSADRRLIVTAVAFTGYVLGVHMLGYVFHGSLLSLVGL
jgi:alpha-1,6-mannosyltransferase